MCMYSLQGVFKNKEACPSSGDFEGIFGGYLEEMWRTVGGHLDEFWRTIVGNLEGIKRRLEVKNLVVKKPYLLISSLSKTLAFRGLGEGID